MSVKDNFPALKPSLLLDFANTKALDPRITFSRASTATFYDGKTVAKAEENRLTYSQDFSNAVWVKGPVTVTANAAVAPDGTSTAATLTANATTSGTFRVWQAKSVSTDSTLDIADSVYVKAGTHNYVTLVLSGDIGTGFIAATFDLSTGTSTKTGNGSAGPTLYTAAISAAGNGWYRISLIGKPAINSANRYLLLYLASSATPTYGANFAEDSWTAAGTETVSIWGAQLEQRSSVTAYTPTTTQPITNYIPVLQTAQANTARFDHNPVTGESLGLRVEEQRTNLLLRSQEFDNAAWTKTDLSVIANTIVAPDGTLTGDLLYPTATGAYKRVYQTATPNWVASSTFTFYAKQSGFRYIGMFNTAGNAVGASFDLQDGVATAHVTGITVSMTLVGNGWYRCIFSSSAGDASIFPIDSAGISTATANGFSGIYIWGAQLEAGDRPTTYIKTEASQVTRSADSQSANSVGQVGQGTIYVDATVNSGNTLVTSGSTTFTATASTRQKTAVAYDASSTRKSINGAAVTSTAGTQGGSSISIAPSATGVINKIAIYPVKATDTNLVALTQG